MNAIEFGATIKKLRQGLGLKRQDLAALVGVVPSMITMIEKGQRTPGPKTTLRMARALQVPVDTLNPELAHLVDETQQLVALPALAS